MSFFNTILVACALLTSSLAVAQEVGDSFGDAFGTCIARVDDLDCDGIADFAVGAPYSSVGQPPLNFAPRLFVFSARTGNLIRELASASPERIGFDVASAPDINGDGFGEIVSGRVVFSGIDGREILAPREAAPAHSTEQFLSASGPEGESRTDETERLFYSPMGEARSKVIEAAFELVRPRLDLAGQLGWAPSFASLAPADGAKQAARLCVERLPLATHESQWAVVLRAANQGSMLVLSSGVNGRALPGVAWVGDLDHDGGADFAFADQDCVRIHSGRTGALLRSVGSYRAGADFGYSIDGGDDLDADGTPDVLVGTCGLDDEYVEAFSGATGIRIAKFQGDFLDHLGASVAFLDDVDGDRVPDIAAGSLWIGMDIHWGEVMVYSGRTHQVLYRVHSPRLPE